jgi:TolB protein
MPEGVSLAILADDRLEGRIVFTRNPIGPAIDGNEIYVLDIASGSLTQLTDNQVPDWNPDWSPDGNSIVFTSFMAGNWDIWVMDGDGSGQATRIATPAWDDYPVWSPDGSQLALSTTGMTAGVPNSEIFVGSSSSNIRQVTFNTGKDEWPTWSPDGQWLANSSDRDGDMDIYLSTPDGGSVTQWTDDPGRDEQPDWSPDGEWIVFQRLTEDINRDGALDEYDAFGNLWIGRRDGSEFRQLTFDHYGAHPTWSPDGEWIVFTHYVDSDEDGQMDPEDASDLWVIPVDGGQPVALTSGREQDWSPDWTR